VEANVQALLGVSVHSRSHEIDDLRLSAKANVMRTLADRLRKNGDWQEFLTSDLAAQMAVGHNHGQNHEESVVSALIHTWAQTSSDEHPHAIMLQVAANELFGDLGLIDSETSTQHLRDKSPRSYREAEQILEREGDAIKAFLFEMYQWTQEFLESKGVDALPVFRGAHAWASGKVGDVFEGRLQPVASFALDPGIAGEFVTLRLEEKWEEAERDVERQVEGAYDAFAVEPDVDEETGEVTEPDPDYVREMWEEEEELVRSDAWDSALGDIKSGIVMYATVPKERILSMCVTGFGCLNEHEVTVLGGTHPMVLIGEFNIDSGKDITSASGGGPGDLAEMYDAMCETFQYDEGEDEEEEE